MLRVGEAFGVRRHDEAAHRSAARAVVGIGARPHDRDVGDPAVGDPRLRTVEDVVGARRGARRCACRPDRCRSPTPSGRSSRSRHRPTCAAATSAFAPPSRGPRSRTSRASPARTRTTGTRSRRLPAPGRRGRTRPRSSRRSRSRAGASRAARGRRAPWPSTSGTCGPRTTPRCSAARGRARTRARCRGSSRSSSVSSASIPRKSVGDGAGTLARCVSGCAVVLMKAASVARAPLLVHLAVRNTSAPLVAVARARDSVRREMVKHRSRAGSRRWTKRNRTSKFSTARSCPA